MLQGGRSPWRESAKVGVPQLGGVREPPPDEPLLKAEQQPVKNRIKKFSGLHAREGGKKIQKVKLSVTNCIIFASLNDTMYEEKPMHIHQTII